MMKKLIALLTFAILCLTAAIAEEAPIPDFLPFESAAPEETPLPKETSTPESANGMIAALYGYTLPFAFDSDPAYSYFDGEIVQADFYFESERVAYDLFLMFPVNVRSGETLNPENAAQWGNEDAGVLLRTITEKGESHAFALAYESQPYPYGTNFSIEFDSVENDGTVLRASGAFSARLLPEFALTSGGYVDISGSFQMEISLKEEIEEDEQDGIRPLDYAR